MTIMTKALTLTTGSSVTAIALLVAAAFALPGPAAAQPESLPVDLPDGPAAPGFDIDRFSNVGNGWFDTFYVERTEPLTDALEEGRVGSDTRVLVIETAAGPLAFLQDQMAFHHLAEGRAGGKDWMASF